MEVIAIAKVVYEVNRAYCQALGDDSQLPWEDAPDWQRESAITAVNFVFTAFESDPKKNHEAWLKEKIAEGWAYGAVKDIDKKLHPCMVDFEALPDAQKAKDFIFLAIVNQLSNL